MKMPEPRMPRLAYSMIIQFERTPILSSTTKKISYSTTEMTNPTIKNIASFQLTGVKYAAMKIENTVKLSKPKLIKTDSTVRFDVTAAKKRLSANVTINNKMQLVGTSMRRFFEKPRGITVASKTNRETSYTQSYPIKVPNTTK